MLKAWDTLVGEARCLFTASVEGGDPEELCEGLVRQVSKLVVEAGGPGTKVAARRDGLRQHYRTGRHARREHRGHQKCLEIKGQDAQRRARCVLGLAAAAVRLPCTKKPVEMRIGGREAPRKHDKRTSRRTTGGGSGASSGGRRKSRATSATPGRVRVRETRSRLLRGPTVG